ncbi:MAG: SDR family oxidoreductase [Deltaproteobacteria bacterium]|nr:SDR family oxidoreductase [Deltaproteobacteria bacterium]
MGRLEGKVAFITGAASGIGAACALRFAREGAKIAGFDVSNDTNDTWKEAAKTASESFFETGDVRDEVRIQDVVNAIAERFGRIDVLVNCAGVAGGGPVHMVPTEDWDRVMDVNLKGTFLVCKHVLSKMIEQESGNIVTIASMEGIEGSEGGSVYNASKAGVVLLTQNMAMDYARKGIRVNSICPGFIDTPLASEMVLDNEVLKDFREALIDGVLLKRVGRPEEIANAALFLASDEASFITGHALVVDGGFTVGHRLGITKIMGLE